MSEAAELRNHVRVLEGRLENDDQWWVERLDKQDELINQQQDLLGQQQELLGRLTDTLTGLLEAIPKAIVDVVAAVERTQRCPLRPAQK